MSAVTCLDDRGLTRGRVYMVMVGSRIREFVDFRFRFVEKRAEVVTCDRKLKVI